MRLLRYDAKALRGHWVKVSFDAKLSKDSVDKLAEYAKINHSELYKADGSVFGEGTRPVENIGNLPVITDEDHTGVPNTASYKVGVRTVKLDENGQPVTDENGNEVTEVKDKYEDESNTVTVKPEEETVINVNITKADMNGTEVEGAVIVVTDKDGNVVDEWVSGTETHTIKDMEPGTYTLVEEVAPAGFKKVKTEITFTVDEDGKVTVTDVQVVDGRVEVDENGTLILFDEPEAPEIEKYVNKAVHKDIALDEVFTYDIIAYVTEDADTVTITDVLNEKVKFAEDPAVTVADLGETDNHKVINNIAGVAVPGNGDATVALQGAAVANAQIVTDVDSKTLTVTIPDAAANRGHWVKVTFKAQLDVEGEKDGNKLDDAKNAYELIGKTENAPVLSDEAHEGVPNNASYVIGVKKVKTDEDGKVVRDEEGKVVKEDEATPTYDDESNTVTVKPEIPDVTKHDIKISKKTLGGDEVAGAHMEITGTTAADETIEKITWTSTTEAKEIQLAPGTYTMVETVAPDDHQRVTTEMVFTVDEDGKVTLTTVEVDNNGEISVAEGTDNHIILEDAPNPDITISKSSLGGKEIEGAVIVLKDDKGNLVDTWVSTTETHTIEKLAPGRYVMKETVAPEGYQQVTTDMIFVVDKDGNVTLETTVVDGGGRLTAEADHINLEDAPIESVDVVLEASKTLVDASGERTLAADEFTFTLSGEGVDQTKTNAADGSVVFDKITYGYEYDENGKATSTPVGTHTYTIIETKETDETDESIVYDTTIKTVTVNITKEGNVLKAVPVYAGDEAVFTNKVLQPGEVTAAFTGTKKLYVNGNETAPAEGEFNFTVTAPDGSVKTVANAADGSIDFGTYTYSEAGIYTYTIAEVIGDAEGVAYDASKYTVTVNVTNGEPVTAEDGTVTETLVADVIYPEGGITFTNTKEEKKPVVISKKDFVSGYELPGAKLTISGDNLEEPINITSSTEPVIVELLPGSYTLTEIKAPAGYIITDPIPFTVGEDGLVDADNVVEMTNSSEKIRDRFTFNVSVEKKWTDGHGNEVSWPDGMSVEFKLQYYDKYTESFVDYKPYGTPVTVTLTQADQVGVFEELEANIDGATAQYRAVETKVAGYTQATSTVTNLLGGVGIMTATNIPEVPGEKEFEVKISKNSLGGTEIEGAHIVVYDAAGAVVEEWDSTTEAHELTLKPGSYTMVETVAPEGYQRVETAITFIVDADGHVTLGTTTVDNGGKISVMDANHVVLEDAPVKEEEKHEVKISKTDLGGTEVEGAHIVLKDDKGNVITEWDSTKDAFTIMLPEGTYVMVETVAPEGFERVTTEMTFTVGEDGKVTLLTTTVDNGGRIKVLDGNHIVLEDAPTTTPTIEKEKDTTETPKTTPTEKRETPSVPTTARRVVTPSSPTVSRATSTGDSNSTTLWIVLASIATAAMIAGAAVMVRRRREDD